MADGFETARWPTGFGQLVVRQLCQLVGQRFWTACFGLVAIGGNEVLGRLIGMASMSWFETGQQVVYCRPVRQLPGQKAEV